jgi:hypothetical protein
MFRHDAALASGKLTRGSLGGQLTYTEVIMSRLPMALVNRLICGGL